MPTAAEVAKDPSLLYSPPGYEKRNKPKKYAAGKKLTPLRKQFAQEYIKNGGIGTKAIIAARAKITPDQEYSPNRASIRLVAHKYLQMPAVRDFIKKADESLLREAQKSVDELAGLRDNSQDEDVRLKASTNLISAYLTVTKRLQDAEKPDPSTTNILVTNMPTEEILARIERLKNGERNA